MSIDKEMNLVIAGTGPDGKPCFLERGEAQVSHTPGVVEVAFLWGIDGIPVLPNGIGGPMEGIVLPAPGGSSCRVISDVP